ncbi:probable sulfite reductase flavoprotein component [Phialocephala subalpina]|uniref:assimilatory sulfite reductase (NADPH) n=1 Tax=Phialocephala subalpina TaxID=576137 RepID=A0A1L7WGQ3_9HELO|nr:probable sulfite reductase flavoprotein component [Phialocephala subalpina]
MGEPMALDTNSLKRKADHGVDYPSKSQAPKGGEVLASTWNSGDDSSSFRKFPQESSSLPFGQSIDYSSISGPTYLTAQTLIQQVAYALSDKIFSYSPESFDLDVAVKEWAAANALNANGYTTQVAPMQTRSGAGSIALGYMFSKDFDLTKRHIPQSLLASSSSLHSLRTSLDQLSLLYSVANPFVAHVAAVDYAPGSARGLVTDYATALTVAEELGLGLVSSSSAYEAQHMSLFSTILASVLPTIHIYDGVNVARDTLRVIDVLNQSGLSSAYTNVLKELEKVSKRADAETKVTQLLNAFNNELGTAYNLFEYRGNNNAEVVLVVFGSVESSLAGQVAEKLAADGTKVGVLNVRVYRPFAEEAFLKALPSSVRSIAVLGQVIDQTAVADEYAHSNLYEDVLAAVVFSEKWHTKPSVVDVKYSRAEVFTPSSIAAIFNQITGKPTDTVERIELLSAGQAEQYTFWDLDESEGAVAPVALGKLFSSNAAVNVVTSQTHDNFVHGGTVRTDIRSSKKSIEASYPVDVADVAYVGEEKLLSEVGIVKNIKNGGKLIVKIPGVKDGDLEKKLSVTLRNEIKFRGIQLFILDPALSAAVEKDASVEALAVELAFLKVAHPDSYEHAGHKLASLGGNVSARSAFVAEISLDLEKILRQIEIPESWAEVEVEKEAPVLPATIKASSFIGFDKEEAEAPSLLRNWESAAKGLAFKEAYGTKSALRPDLSTKTYEITVQENRRLTPLTYDRNIFHIEFDIGTSRLNYNIGEALGIHAENDVDEVNEFMKFYGLNPDDIVEVPSREDPSVLDTRTVFQSLVQNIDIFGKPPKRFYEALAEFASDENEKKELLTLGGPEGANEFKRRAEVDTITFADILLEFKSAHPSFHDIARIVSPMKRREYSIASSQMVNPTTVALMIVVVSWVDPKGRDRFGQATRYLSKLPIGSKVTASVKPSVMKLPVKDTAPLIMAGLGTGLAPFRAFVQYRAMQKAQGKEIGSILLYMGSRHQREEYLYGEEWEAYQDAGVITLLGRAFSRDQPQKIYIQDRMRQTIQDIIKAYIHEEGAFYLCGPTWPVPDVTEVLEEAIKRDAVAKGAKKVDSRKEIERLKEELRYVLEVY